MLRFDRLTLFVLLAVFPITSFGYEREFISFKSSESYRLFRGRQQRVEIVSSLKGSLAIITANRKDAGIEYAFPTIKVGLGVSTDVSDPFAMTRNIRNFRDIFGGIGFPQFASVTTIGGGLYGLIFTTKSDLDPDHLELRIPFEVSGPIINEAQRFRQRSTVTAGFGSKFAGIPAALYDTAVLAKLDGDRPEILKVYELVNRPANIWVGHLYRALYEYTYADLVRLDARRFSCETLFTPSPKEL